MKLVIDIGNTLIKLAVFKQKKIIAIENLKTFSASDISEILNNSPKILSAIVSNVRSLNLDFLQDFNQRIPIVELNTKTRLPINNLYKTPETLGKDRLAASIGAAEIFPETNILVIDAGTSLTYDIITAQGDYLGGAIGPGITMRFKALHTFTGKLPLVQPEWNDAPQLIGNTTETSILVGVQNAVLCEVDGMIMGYKQQFPNLKVIVTGGDHKYFDKYLKNNIFAAPNLVLTGLKKILDFNEED